MYRRTRGLVCAVALFIAPAAARATNADMDPDGLELVTTQLPAWLEAFARVLLSYAGV